MKIAIIGIILLSALLLGCTNTTEQKQPTELKKTALDASDLEAAALENSDLPIGYAGSQGNSSEIILPEGAKYANLLAYAPKNLNDNNRKHLIFSSVMIFEKGAEYPYCTAKSILDGIGTKTITNKTDGWNTSSKRIEDAGQEAGMILLERNGITEGVLAGGYYSNAYFAIRIFRQETGITEQEVIKYMQSISKKLKERCPNCAPNPRKCTSENTTA